MDRQELIGLLATKHGVAVSEDDPVMLLHTLNEVLAEENAKAQAELLVKFKKQMEGAAEVWSTTTRAQAQAVLQQALAGSRDLIAKSTAGAFEKLTETARQDLSRLERVEHRLTWLLVGNVVASLITFTAAAVLLVKAGLL
jgi:hypothetical protein